MKKLTSRLHVLFYFISWFCYAQIPAVQDTTVGFAIIADQDFFTPQNQDRNYTMGLSFNFYGPVFDKNALVVPLFRKGADWLFGLKRWHNQNGATIFISSMQLFDGAFTPLDLKSTTPVTNDRPYGNVLGIGASRTTLINGDKDDISKQSAITSRFVVGVIGTRIAEEVQTYIHREYFPERDVPLGWPNQISDGGEPTLLYQVQYMKPIFEDVSPTGMKRIQATWMLETNVGYYTNMATGFAFRIGRFKTPFWKFTNSGMSVVSQKAANDDQLEFNIYLQMRGRAVVYNALLQGQFRKNEYELSGRDVNRILLEAEAGVLVHYRAFTIIFAPYLTRTSEISIGEPRNHSWGSLAIFYNW